MKRILTKKRLLFLVFLLGMTAFGFGVTSLSAQAPDNAKWKSTVDAMTTLNQEIGVIDAILQANPGDINTMFKRKFYYSIGVALEDGQVPLTAINRSYAMFVPATGPSTFAVELIPNPVPLATWDGYYQQVVQLLQY